MVRLLSAGVACVALCLPVSVLARRALLRDARDGVLSNQPVVFAQLSKAIEVTRVPCETVQLTGVMPETAFVKLSGAGWAEGSLDFQVSEQMSSEREDKGQKLLFLISCYPKNDTDVLDESKKGKCFSTDFSKTNNQNGAGGGAAPEVNEISLPIDSHEDAFMFICSRKDSTLSCDVYGYDNGGDSGWKSKTIQVNLTRIPQRMSFRIQASGMTAPKAYVSSGLMFDTSDTSLGCTTKTGAEASSSSPSPADAVGALSSVDAQDEEEPGDDDEDDAYDEEARRLGKMFDYSAANVEDAEEAENKGDASDKSSAQEA